jgi:RNA polymerase sigma factor (sigma-70 family)
MLAIDRGLARLHEVDERLARVVEWRFFGGMTEEEVAEAMGVTARTVRRDWQKARAFLCRELQDESADRP